MISFYNTYGKIGITSGYFAELVSSAAQSGLGVAGMAAGNVGKSFIDLVFPDRPDKGVQVTEEDGMLVLSLHIKVSYGINIAAAVKSITHHVQYVVEEATSLKVKRIDVSVDDVIA